MTSRDLVPTGASRLMHAFIDESGQRGISPKASDYFVLSAVVACDDALGRIHHDLETLRRDLRRGSGQTLHFQNLKSHTERIHAAKSLGAMEGLAILSVVVCKRELTVADRLSADVAYMYTLRYLLERLSWYARDEGAELGYTLAHIKGFQKSKLREYERRLRGLPGSDCRIEWSHLAAAGGSIDQPERVEGLQIADLAASGVAQAFEDDEHGNTETRYLIEMLPRVWARGDGPNRYTTYGLKIHPKTGIANHSWIAELGARQSAQAD